MQNTIKYMCKKHPKFKLITLLMFLGVVAACDGALDKDDVGSPRPASSSSSTSSSSTSSSSSASSSSSSASSTGSQPDNNADTDGDGVPDAVDQCVSLSGEKVGITGCSGIPALGAGEIISPQIRLTKKEYRTTIQRAFNVDRLAPADYLFDQTGVFDTYRNNANDLTDNFDRLVLGALNIAQGVAANMIRTSSALQQCSWHTDLLPCVERYLNEPLKVLYRQQIISDTDLQVIAGIMRKVFDKNASLEQALAAGIMRALIDDRLVYRFEEGLGRSTEDVTLSDQEFINRLAYFLIDSPPNEDLNSVISDIVGNEVLIRSNAHRLTQSERYSDVIWDFISQWLNIRKTITSGNNLDLKVESSSLEETRRFVDYVLVQQKGKLSDLFTANYSFIDSTLATHYGVPRPKKDWGKYIFPEGSKRKGILTHASFLTSNADRGGSTTISRAVRVNESFFCIDLPTKLGIFPSSRPADRLNDPECKDCHENLDPIGFLFDPYSDRGTVGSRPSPSPFLPGKVNLLVDIAGDYDNVLDFADALAGSHAMRHCLARQLYRFALGRDPKASEQESFDQVFDALVQEDSLYSAILSFTASKSFASVYTKPNTAACPR